MYCCVCSVSLPEHCPICRARFDVPGAVSFERLEKMLKDRSQGRHTALAEYNLGTMYDTGEVVAQNYEKAVKFYRRAAKRGYPSAQCNLGNMYSAGKGVTIDREKAIKWYRLGAEQGHATSQENLSSHLAAPTSSRALKVKEFLRLGAQHANGDGVPRSHEAAIRFFQQALDLNFRGTDLAAMYCEGFVDAGVVQNHAEAFKLYQSMAEQGDARAQGELGNMFKASQDLELAFEWRRRGADQGDVEAQYNLGNMYKEGVWVSPDLGEAIKWYELAAEQGHRSARFNLAVSHCFEGSGVYFDLDKAEYWCKLAADMGHARADYIQQLIDAMRAVQQGRTPIQPDCDGFPPGTEVIVCGLVKAAELNGKTGMILRWLPDRSRCIVDLDGVGPRSIKAANVAPHGTYGDATHPDPVLLSTPL